MAPSLSAPLTDNIRAHLSNLEAPANCEVTARFEREARERIVKAAQGLGYYQSEVVSFSPSSDGQCTDWSLNFVPGERATLSDINISLLGEGKTDAELNQVIAGLPMTAGSVLDHGAYESAKTRLLNTALARGYFDFTFEKRELVVNTDTNQAKITLRAATGKRYHFASTKGVRDPQTQQLVDELRPYQIGEPYLASKLDTFNRRLRATGYFQHVLARPVLSEAANEAIPIELMYAEKPTSIIDLGGGFSSDTGLRGRIVWQRPRLNAAGHSLRTELFASLPEQSLSMKYRIPLADPANNYLSLQGGIKAVNDNDTESETLSLAAQRHWVGEASEWRKIAFLRFDMETFTQADEPEEQTKLLLPGFTLSRLRSEGGLQPVWGDRQMVTLEAGSKEIVSDIDLARITLQSRWLRSFGEHRALVKIELGGLAASDFDAVPSTLRYFAGGDQSVRGFAYQTLAPRNENDELIGGKYLYTASVEYDIPVADNWRVAAFVDTGNASDEFLSDAAIGVGGGVIWTSPVGPVRFYLARGNYQDEKSWRIHVSLGASL